MACSSCCSVSLGGDRRPSLVSLPVGSTHLLWKMLRGSCAILSRTWFHSQVVSDPPCQRPRPPSPPHRQTLSQKQREVANRAPRRGSSAHRVSVPPVRLNVPVSNTVILCFLSLVRVRCFSPLPGSTVLVFHLDFIPCFRMFFSVFSRIFLPVSQLVSMFFFDFMWFPSFDLFCPSCIW